MARQNSEEPGPPATLFTIGFTHKSAEEFFGALKTAGVRRVADIRLKNESQLAGFSKKHDLQYFLRELAGIEYAHIPGLAPTPELLEGYRKKKLAWPEYEERFLTLMADRNIETRLSPAELDRSCLLCSELSPERCHRRLVAEYLQEKWGNLVIQHL
jgi:uncharacterized protein (DUF488 family)